MGEVIHQHPIRARTVRMFMLASLLALAVRVVGSHILGVGLEARVLLPVAAAGALIAAWSLAASLRYRSFPLDPGTVSGIYRAPRRKELLLTFTSGKSRRVELTGSTGDTGTAAQLLRALPSAAGPTIATSTIPGMDPTPGGAWRPVSTREVLEELQRITGGAADEPAVRPAGSGTARRPTDSGTARRPTRALVQQWESDDEEAIAELRSRGIKQGTFVPLGLLMWVLMLGGLVYLGSGDDRDPTQEMNTAITIWVTALLLGAVRGVLVDLRASKARGSAVELMRTSTRFAARGMPEPWVQAASWSPNGFAGHLRTVAILAGILFGLGLSNTVPEGKTSASVVLGVLLLILLATWLGATRFIHWRRKRNRRVALEYAGARRYWIENPEELARLTLKWADEDAAAYEPRADGPA